MPGHDTSFFLIPAIFLIPFIFSASDRFQLKKMLPILVLLSIVFIGWKISYDYFRKDTNITTFMTTPGILEKYSRNRTELLVSAFKFGTEDIMHFVFGVGSANASHSFSRSMTGQYYDEYDRPFTVKNQISTFIWEIGFGGIFIFYILLWMLFYDAKKYSLLSNYYGIISLAMISVILIFGASFFYKQIFEVNILTYNFFFLSGFIASGNHYSKKWNMQNYL